MFLAGLCRFDDKRLCAGQYLVGVADYIADSMVGVFCRSDIAVPVVNVYSRTGPSVGQADEVVSSRLEFLRGGSHDGAFVFLRKSPPPSQQPALRHQT